MSGSARRQRTRALVAAAIVAVAAALAGAQLAADARLRHDWNDLVSAAARHGVVVSGTGRSELGALRVTGVTALPALSASFAPTASIHTLVLRRSPFDLFRPSVTLAAPVDLAFPGGQQVDLWSRQFRFTRDGPRWRFSGVGVSGALAGGGPDDTVSFGTIGGDLAVVGLAGGEAWTLAGAATGVILPARGAWPTGRLIERASAALLLGPASGSLTLERATAISGGQTAQLSFAGRLDGQRRLEGRGTVALGPGWADTIKHAHATGAFPAGEAAAAIGFLGLLAPDERSPVSFPIEADGGHLRVGPTTLFTLPAWPVAR